MRIKPARGWAEAPGDTRGAFTLIELLVVIAIIPIASRTSDFIRPSAIVPGPQIHSGIGNRSRAGYNRRQPDDADSYPKLTE